MVGVPVSWIGRPGENRGVGGPPGVALRGSAGNSAYRSVGRSAAMVAPEGPKGRSAKRPTQRGEMKICQEDHLD